MPTGPTEWEQENKGVAQDAFQQSASPEPSQDPPEANQGMGSHMVQNDAPEPALRPDGPLRDAVDREVYSQNLAAENAAANQLNQEQVDALKANEQIQAFEQGTLEPEQAQEQPSQEFSEQEIEKALELNAMFNDLSQGQSQEQEISR